MACALPTELRRYVLEFRRYGLVGKVGFEPTKPEGSGFTVRPNSPSLALTLVRPVIYSLLTEDFTHLALMPLFFAIEPPSTKLGLTVEMNSRFQRPGQDAYACALP